MSEELRTDGSAVEIEGVTISTPGLGGIVEVHLPSSPALRGADDATAAFVEALEATGVDEQLTIEMLDTYEEPGYEDVALETTQGEPGFAVDVPGPGSGMGQVLLAKDEAGVLRWIISDEDDDDSRADRGTNTRRYVVPLAVATGDTGGNRGLLGVIGKKLLKVFAFRLLDAGTSAAANYFATEWEKRKHPHRLRTFTPDSFKDPLPGYPGLTRREIADFSVGPSLLFVHGTMSLSHSGFGRFPSDLMGQLYDVYEGRVFAFDHPTVSIGPKENAEWLASQFEASLTLDIIAHSRGGLVGRELVERPHLAGFNGNRPSVRTLMMVGTPNSGTPLASPKKLGSLVDRVTNLLDLIPDNAVTDVISILITVVKQIAVNALDGLDGLTCMEPESRYLKGIADATGPASESRYVTVASNYEPEPNAPLARIARDGAIDLVFGLADNDLIVPTEGVYTQDGAPMFPVATKYLHPSSAAVDHSGYWESNLFREVVLSELIGPNR